MDPVTLGYYAIVGAILGVISPGLGPMGTRLIVGAGVGVTAAALLPIIRTSLGI